MTAISENRFLRAYKEFKEEQSRDRVILQVNRFECLKEGPISTNTFMNLDKPQYDWSNVRQTNISNQSHMPLPQPQLTQIVSNVSQQDIHINMEPATTYISNTSPYGAARPKEQPINKLPPVKFTPVALKKAPPISTESNYHFPELSPNIKPIKPHEFKQKEILSKPIGLEKTGFVSLSLKNGNIVKKDLYNLSNDLSDNLGVEIEQKKEVKRNTFTSWASVVKSQPENTSEVNDDDNDFIVIKY